MSESRMLEVRPGDTVFVCRVDGHCNMHYVDHGGHLSEMLEGFEKFLLGAGFGFDGHIDFCDDYGGSKWAVEVRNFLADLTDQNAAPATSYEFIAKAQKLLDA